MTRQAVTQHLAVLEAANLVATVRRGREKLHYLNPVPIHEIYERWVRKFETGRLGLLRELNRSVADLGPADAPRIGAGRHPLAFTGLALAGANSPAKPGDGILTGLDIVELPLEGLRFFRLSPIALVHSTAANRPIEHERTQLASSRQTCQLALTWRGDMAD